MNWISNTRHFVFDLDGTLILGNQVLPYARETLDLIRSQGKSFTVVTNNSSRSIDNYFRFLTFLGFTIKPNEIHTSGKATAQYINQLKPEPSVYLLGTRALVEDFSAFGIACVNDIDAEPIDFVVLAFDQEITYKRIVEASILIRSGIPFIATHADINIPTERGLLPDCGSLISLFQTSTGIKPKVIGKPNIEMVEPILKQVGVKRDEMVIVGDRMYTDIEMGWRAGIKTIWVKTGDLNNNHLTSPGVSATSEIQTLEPLFHALLNLS